MIGAALRTTDGDDYTVSDISKNRQLRDHYVASYAAAIREGGEAQGCVLRVLAVFYDWDTRDNAVWKGMRLSDSERSHARCLYGCA
jgi:hypothetical protein